MDQWSCAQNDWKLQIRNSTHWIRRVKRPRCLFSGFAIHCPTVSGFESGFHRWIPSNPDPKWGSDKGGVFSKVKVKIKLDQRFKQIIRFKFLRQISKTCQNLLNNKIGHACALYSVKVLADCPYLYGFSVSILSLAAQYFQSDFVFEVLI